MRIISDPNVINEENWHSIINNSPYSSPFQTPEFYKLFNSVEDLSADVFAVEQNGEYTTLVVVTLQKESGIKGYFSRRGIVYGGPLVANSQRESLEFLLKSIVNHYKNKLIYIEIRKFFDYSQYVGKSFRNYWQYLPYLNFRLDLKGKELNEIKRGMKYNRRREIRLSLERNAIYKQCETEEELFDLYKILYDLYKTRVKLPLFDYSFFKALWRSEIGKVFIVLHNNRIIGGSFCVYLKNHSIYTMYYCGMRDYDKKIFPTHLSILAAIEYGIKNDLKYLDFMGAGLKGEEYGVRKYKQEFGGDLNEYGRYRKVLKPLLFKVGETGLKILSKIK